MRQYIGVLLTAIAVLILAATRDSLPTILGMSIYVVGVVLILIPQRRPARGEAEERRQETKRPTPDELKKRPIQPPEI